MGSSVFFKLNLKKISFFNKLQRVLSVEVSHTYLKKCNTALLDCSLLTESQLCAELTESRTLHRWIAKYESDSQYFVHRDEIQSQWKLPFKIAYRCESRNAVKCTEGIR